MTPTPDHAAGPSGDPFGTAEVRSAVLESWRRSPARLREDANAEESLVLVGYAGRTLVELAANAADAAIEAGVSGRLRIAVEGHELRVANTGAALTADGVASLASLRASSKRGDSAGIGHFGVGFTAALAISDRPTVLSATGGVTFSGALTAEAVAGLGSPALDAEVVAREGHVPVLRLPWPSDGQVPAGYTTEVRLPLLPGLDVADVLSGVGDHLMLALPGLDVIELPGRVLVREPSDDGATVLSDNGVVTRWQLSSRSGRLDDELLAGLPTEQRQRRDWRLSWAYPSGGGLGQDVLYSPTPTDELLGLPARLIGTFPVDDTRRHLAAGPITDLLLREAVIGYLQLMADTPAADRLRLLPAGDFGRSELDNRLRQGIWAAVRMTPLLLSVSGEAVRPDQAVMLPAATPELLTLAAEAVPGLLPAPQDSVEREGLRALGVRTIGYPELSTAFGALSRDAAFWGSVYAELDVAAADDLSDLPIPLVGSRTVLGARGCLVADDATAGLLDTLARAVPGLRVVHPDASSTPAIRRLLLRIGARTADPTAVLADPAVLQAVSELREEVDAADDDEDVSQRVELLGVAVLDLVAAGAVPTPQLRAGLLLTTADGEPWPVEALMLPDAPLATVLADDADVEQVARLWNERYDDDTLRRAGVLSGFRVVHDDEPHGPDHDLPDEDEYWDQVIGDREPPAGFTAVADLDLVDDDRWVAALDLLSDDRDARATLRSGSDLPTYTSWWLGRFALIGGEPPRWWRTAGAADLIGLYDPLPIVLDPDFAAAIGVRNSLATLLAEDPEDLLARFTDSRRAVPAPRVASLTAALVAAMRGRPVDRLPAGVRTMSGAVVDADDAVVLDEPWLSAVLDPGVVVPGGADPTAVARFFDLEPASDRYRFAPPAVNPAGRIDERVEQVATDFGVADRLTEVTVDPELHVAEPTGPGRRVSWWVADGAAWVDGSSDGWGRWIAYRAGRWSKRHTASAMVAGVGAVVVEDGLADGSSGDALGVTSSS